MTSEAMRSDNGRSLDITDAIDNLSIKVDRLDVSIRGNGKPGLNIRVDRLEQYAKWQSRIAMAIVPGVLLLVVAEIASHIWK
jgi:hypothetical protein